MKYQYERRNGKVLVTEDPADVEQRFKRWLQELSHPDNADRYAYLLKEQGLRALRISKAIKVEFMRKNPRLFPAVCGFFDLSSGRQ
jgi:hypothetical protein